MHLAARYCAKEAVAKALGLTGWSFRDVEVVATAAAPQVRLTGSAAGSAAEQGVSARISLTHTETTAGAGHRRLAGRSGARRSAAGILRRVHPPAVGGVVPFGSNVTLGAPNPRVRTHYPRRCRPSSSSTHTRSKASSMPGSLHSEAWAGLWNRVVASSTARPAAAGSVLSNSPARRRRPRFGPAAPRARGRGPPPPRERPPPAPCRWRTSRDRPAPCCAWWPRGGRASAAGARERDRRSRRPRPAAATPARASAQSPRRAARPCWGNGGTRCRGSPRAREPHRPRSPWPGRSGAGRPRPPPARARR